MGITDKLITLADTRSLSDLHVDSHLDNHDMAYRQVESNADAECTPETEKSHLLNRYMRPGAIAVSYSPSYHREYRL